jgi:acetylornithine deacetylase/succinyl-diaminopimelate desuccinylase-like protein
MVQDPADGIPAGEKKVIYLDGHSDTVRPLRAQWLQKLGGGVDCFNGLTDPARKEWDHLLFGRGSADQLGGVVAEAVACRILLELAPEGALRGVIVRAYATACEEDNDGAGPMYIRSKVLPGARPELIPAPAARSRARWASTAASAAACRSR